MAKTFKSNTYDGRYLQLSISETVDAKNNRSKLTWTLKSTGGNSSYYSIAETTVKINGTQVYHKNATDWSSQTFPAAKGSTSGSLYVNHNSDGSKSINVVFSTRVYYGGAEEYGGTMTLTTIDRSAPTVKVSIGTITANSIKITVTSSATADQWLYSLNGGSYTTFDSSTGTSKAYTITGLSSNTSYTIRARARKDSNEVTGTSAAVTVKTLGASTIKSRTDIVADAATVSFSITPSIYNSDYTHTLKLKIRSTTLTFSNIPLVNNEQYTITLTSAQRTTLLNAMSDTPNLDGILELTCYNNGTAVGDPTTVSIPIWTTEENSSPTFPGFTYCDTDENTLFATQNDQVLVQNMSNLQITVSPATAINGATIVGYSVKVGSVEVTSAETTIDVGKIPESGDMYIFVSAIDSRGYVDYQHIEVHVIPYKPVKIVGNDLIAHRRNEVDPVVKVRVMGTISSVPVEGVEKNRLAYGRYRYKKTSEQAWSSWVNLTSSFTISGSSFSLGSSSNEFELSTAFDDASSYYLEFEVCDMLITIDSYIFTIPQGIPLLAYRKNKLGINNTNPQVALDVVGDAIISGKVSINGMPVYAELATGQSWSSGNLDVPNISKYSLLIFKLSGESTRMLCVNSGGVIRGGTVWVNASGHIISYAVSATITNDRLTYINSGYMRHNASGNHGAWTQVAVSDIIGII